VRVTNTRNAVSNSTDSSTATVTVVPAPTLNGFTVIPVTATIQSGQVATITISATVSVGTLSYQWYQGASGVTTTPVGTNSATFTTPALASTTQYWVRVTNTLNAVTNSTDSGTQTITVSAGGSKPQTRRQFGQVRGPPRARAR
jgi:hypothetical protein